ncbi:Lcl domain-containing protein [Shewanella woodyi]|uniref:Lcl C-terminal domain-containing protein n=1 Tax=Shewanella woodyi (strain ATCC 51908 / MS32) TaxID=392500 RepID=B1KQ94_SHEWM|nr:DUF1566 domain-containing protein [Shewanella woodyi]ACA84749.1 protein of unknown function DUF1566 [Shewanella woodyi ATCC 51908]
MNVLTRLSILLIMITGLGACGGSDKSTTPEPEKPNPVIEPKTELKGIPDSFQVKACIDEDADFTCDATPVAITEVYKGIDIDKLAPDARVLIELAPPEATGIGSFIAFEGKRFMSFPVGEEEASPFNLLALGVVQYAQELGEDWCCGHAIPLNLKEAKSYLAQNFKLDGSGQQNEAILQAFNSNLEQLGGNGLSLKQAYDADIKAMAESLVDLTLHSQSICDRVPEYCEGNPDDPYPPIDLSNIVPCITAYDGGSCVAQIPKLQVESTVTDEMFRLTQKEAGNIAYNIRSREKEPLPFEKAFEQLTCKDDEEKQVFMYGVGDNFATTNIENTSPSAALTAWLGTVPNNLVHPYDFDASISPANPNIFADTLSNLPSDLTNGLLVMGLKERGFTLSDTPNYFDIFAIGDATNISSNANVSGTVSDIRSSWQSVSPNVYFENLQNIQNQAGTQSLLDKLHAGQTDLDLVMMPTTNVDFVAVAACRVKAPQKPIETPVKEVISVLTEKFTCNAEQGETYYEIVGGEPDDFTPGSDQNTPSTALSSLTGTLVTYDQIEAKDSTFIDTLALPSGSSITKAQFMINARATSPSAANDKVFLANTPLNNMVTGFTTTAPGALVTQWPNGTLNGGAAYIIDGLFNIPSLPTTPNLLTILNSANASGSGLDILVSENTEVDTTLLQLCINTGDQPCVDTDGDGYCDEEEKDAGSDPTNPDSTPIDLDGDGALNDDDCDPNDPTVTDQCNEVIYTDVLPESCSEYVTVDLSLANSWANSAGNPPVVNNVFDGTQYQGIVWDGALSWFDFGSASNVTHKLNQDFCSCGGGKVVIDEFKSDNMGYIDLNNLTNQTANRIVSRTQYSQSTMASWGPSESGSNTFSGTGNGVDFNLELGVQNVSGPSGGAVKGRLEFIGHLGACTTQDVVDNSGGTGTVGGVGPAINVGSIAVTHELLSNLPVIQETTAPFIKLDDNGNPLAEQTLPWSDTGSESEGTQWSCVKDVATNLIWEVKRNSNGIKKESLHDADDVYAWFDPDPTTNGGFSGANTSGNFCFGFDANDSSTFCNSQRFEDSVNNADFCGSADGWRLPTIEELEGLVDTNYATPMINGAYFPNTPLQSAFWSSTTNPNDSNKAEHLFFYNGQSYNSTSKTYTAASVRLVRDQ